MRERHKTCVLAFTNLHFPRVIYYSRAHNASNFTLCHLRM